MTAAKYKVGDKIKLVYPYYKYDMDGLTGVITEVDMSGQQVKDIPYYNITLDEVYNSKSRKDLPQYDFSIQKIGRSEREIELI